MHDVLILGRVLLRCLVQTAAIGAVAMATTWLLPRAARRGAFLGAVALVVPGLLLALRPGLWRIGMPGFERPPGWPGTGPAPHWLLVPAALPLLLVFPLGRAAAMPPDQARAALGLGAGPWTRFVLVWLPQFRWPALLGLGSAAGLDALALFGG
ncbi:MAG: hypothetical protein INR65_03310 [Gluconacetobacter diazotrophicus]|nr:hypothetical protein [Gluconacetobacter diazotrophicus]